MCNLYSVQAQSDSKFKSFYYKEVWFMEKKKVIALLGKPTSTDITTEEMLHEWEGLGTIPGVTYIVKQYETFPTVEEFNALIDEDADAALGVWITHKFLTEEFFQSHPRLKYLAGLAHGYEAMDFSVSRRYGVTITNTAYGASTVAEYAFALLLDICHKVELHSQYVKETDWSAPDAPKYMYALTKQLELCNMTFGVIGLGKIGWHAASIARGFGMKVIAYSRHKKEGPEYDFIEQVSLDELYARADVISLHAPLNDGTRKMINAESIRKMKDGVILINTARGALVDEAALTEGLKTGKVYAAGLDVLNEEPPVHANALLAQPNATITGHIAWLPKTSRLRQVSLAIHNYQSYLDGKPVSVIN